MLYRGEVLNEELRAVAADFLSRVRSFDELQRYIPDAVTLWHKPGGLDHLTHDAGVFFLKGRPTSSASLPGTARLWTDSRSRRGSSAASRASSTTL